MDALRDFLFIASFTAVIVTLGIVFARKERRVAVHETKVPTKQVA